MAAPATRCPVHAEFDPLGVFRDPETFSAATAMRITFSLSFAGHETTNNLIGNCVRRGIQAVPFHPNISFRAPQALWVDA